MMVVKFRSHSEAKDTLKRLKKMHKFTKELIDCFEEKIEDDDDDYDEDYKDDDDWHEEDPRMKKRYRKGGMR